MILVTCGIIFRDDKILVTQRGSQMKQPLKWEFPGGKIEPGESPEQCLHREIMEELNIEIKILQRLPDHSYQYPEFQITLIPFLAQYLSGEIKLLEHAQFKWVSRSELNLLDWVPADVKIAELLNNNTY